MATYKFPMGSLSVLRHGEYQMGAGFGLRYRYNVKAVDTEGNVFRSWITTPDGWSEDYIVTAALDAVGEEVSKKTGDDTGSDWSTFALAEEDEFAASYNVSRTPSHYRVQPYTYAPDGDTFGTVSDIVEYARQSWNGGFVNPGDVVDVYRNNDDEPTFRFKYGPRGGLTRENY